MVAQDSHSVMYFHPQSPSNALDQLLVAGMISSYSALENVCFCTFIFPNLCWYYTAAGDILIWDRDTAALLHHIHPTDPDQDLTCIACNRLTGDPFAIATGGHDGNIRIWTTFSSLSPMSPSCDGHDMTSGSESPLSSYSPRGWSTDKIPADHFLKVVVPPRRRRSPSMVSTAFRSRSSSESTCMTQGSTNRKSDEQL